MTRLELLELALEGAQMRRGVAQNLEPEEWQALDDQLNDVRRLIEAEHRRLNRIGMENAR